MGGPSLLWGQVPFEDLMETTHPSSHFHTPRVPQVEGITKVHWHTLEEPTDCQPFWQPSSPSPTLPTPSGAPLHPPGSTSLQSHLAGLISHHVLQHLHYLLTKITERVQLLSLERQVTLLEKEVPQSGLSDTPTLEGHQEGSPGSFPASRMTHGLSVHMRT